MAMSIRLSQNSCEAPVGDPYAQKMTSRAFFASKADVVGRVVAVLRGTLEARSLQLIPPISRAFPAGAIIELISTDEQGAGPGTTVDRIGYIAFVELTTGGILLAGDPVESEGRTIGTIAGYDDTHMPNHQNVILKTDERVTGEGLGLAPGMPILIRGFQS
jgi:hypothetical protein